MELPKELLAKLNRDKAREQKMKSKINSSLEYKRRKLDKDVRRYIKDHKRINSREIEDIGIRHGFHVNGVPFRKNKVPREDAAVLFKRKE